MLTGSIAAFGSQYLITVNAVDASSGDTLTQTQQRAASKEAVLDALGKAASDLRGKLGESLASIHKFDKPLEQVTTGSLEALKAFTLGEQLHGNEEDLPSIPFYERAIELDPNFAVAYTKLGVVYGNTGQDARAEELMKKAFDLRERASEREKLYIASLYYFRTGQVEKAIETYELYKQSYPRDATAWVNAGVTYTDIGQTERALENYKEAVRLNPDMVVAYSNQAWSYMTLGRFDEAKAILDQEAQRKLGGGSLHAVLSQVALLAGDTASAAREEALAGNDPNWQLFFLRRNGRVRRRSAGRQRRPRSMSTGGVRRPAGPIPPPSRRSSFHPRVGIGAVKLIQPAIGIVENQHVAVAAAGIGIALDGSIRRDRHRSGIALIAVGREVDVHRRLRTTHHDIGNSNVRAVVQTGTEVRMQPDRRTNEVDHGRGIGIDGRGRDILVPGIVGGEGKKAIQAGALAKADGAAGAGVAATTARTDRAAVAGVGASDAATGDQQRKEQDGCKHHSCAHGCHYCGPPPEPGNGAVEHPGSVFQTCTRDSAWR